MKSKGSHAPCPFCGHKDVFMCGGGDDYWVECSWCHAFGPTADTERKAWAAWDRREGEK
jgi:hypothetical protein